MERSQEILKHLDNPHELEKMYRKNPEGFQKAFLSAWEQRKDSPILKVWYERLFFEENEKPEKKESARREIFLMIILAILAGVMIRMIFHFVDQNAIPATNLVFGILPFMAAYFVFQNPPQRKLIYTLITLFLISAIYLNFLPLESKDSIYLAYFHLPVFLWFLTGLAYTGNQYQSSSRRLAYLKFNGQFLILYACMAICGGILALLTLQLFELLDLNIHEFYFKNVVLFGAAALAIVTTYLVIQNPKLVKNVAPYLAQIFSPLVLATLTIYLLAMIGVRKNPFLDRDFLLSFNIIFLVVLAVTLYSITERGTSEKKKISDYINFALISLSLIMDTIALSSMIFRLFSYGITPNRMAMLGLNVLIWINLIWVFLSFLRFFQNKAGLTAIQNSITKYLPIYGLWAAFVTFTFPWIFHR